MTLLPEVRSELLAAAARQAAAGTVRRRTQRLDGGAIAVALGVACALVVGVVALVTLGHHASAPPSSAPGSSELAALEAKLAVLRRPQTPADRGYARAVSGRGSLAPVGLVGRLSRLATTITAPSAGPVRVYVLVRQQPARLGVPVPPALRTGVVIAVAIDRRGAVQGQVAVGAAAPMTPSTVSAGPVVRGLGPDSNRGVSLAIVPDGVARVKWTFTGAGYGILAPRPVTVYPKVHGNVAVAPVRPGQGPLASAVWYGAGGRVLASSGPGRTALRELARINAVNASRSRPIAPELVAHYRLFRSVPPLDLKRVAVLPTAAGGASDLNFWQTRYIASVTGIDGPGLWITPGTRDACVSDPMAGGCTAPLNRRDDAGILAGGSFGSGQATITGLVPDGNRSVVVVLAGGVEKRFPVIDNVYEVTVRGHPMAIINRDIHGRIVRTPLGY